MTSTYGPAYDEKVDGPAIKKQTDRIKSLMLDGFWRTLTEISRCLAYPEASVSSQLRHMRKPQFGSYKVDKRRRENQRVWEYRVTEPAKVQMDLISR